MWISKPISNLLVPQAASCDGNVYQVTPYGDPPPQVCCLFKRLGLHAGTLFYYHIYVCTFIVLYDYGNDICIYINVNEYNILQVESM